MKNSPKLIVIVGETASGKSALAMEIAQKFNGEIINADSWQVYKSFNIGTAKPSAAERAQVPHHLLDIVEATDDFSAAVYKKLALKAIGDVSARAKLPIMVGGTGLYVNSVIFNYSFLPVGESKIHTELINKTIPQLITEAAAKGYDLSDIDTRNKRRLVRLIETGGQRPTRSAGLPANILVLGVHIPRGQLRQRIEQRVELMFKRGLKHEVRELADKYGWDNEAMKGIGYREFKPYLEAQISVSDLKRQIIRSTLQLAKRQRTWLKRNPDIIWISTVEEGLGAAQKFVRPPR